MSDACYCDYDAPQFYNRSTPVARKPHQCEECDRVIQPGERYERVFGLWEGYTNEFKTCSHCLDLREWAIISFPCFKGCWAHGNTLDDIREFVTEEFHKVPGLFFEYGRRVIRARQFRKAQRAQA